MAYIRSKLIFENPFDFSLFQLFRSTTSFIVVPRGFPILQHLNPKDIEVDVVDSPIDFELTDGYELREYQKPAAHSILDHFKGKLYAELLLRAATGSGKTYCLSYILKHLKKRTLILSHLTLLSEQMLQEISTNTTADVQILTKASINKPLADINICSFALLAANSGLVNYLRDNISILVVDETENMVTDSRSLIIFRLKFMYAIYMSATPTKELVDQTAGVRAITGETEVLMEPTDNYVVNPVVGELYYPDFYWKSPKNKNLYKKSLYSLLVKEDILTLIMVVLVQLIKFEGTVWVIADYKILQEDLVARLTALGHTAAIINSETNKKDRLKILQAIADGTLDVVIGSAPLSAGVSIPNLSAAIRLMPHSSSEEVLEQQIGRLKRLAPFKKKQPPLWFDFSVTGSLNVGAGYRKDYYNARNIPILPALEAIKLWEA